MTFTVGEVVKIRSGCSNAVLTTGNVYRVSPKGKRLIVTDTSGATRTFYLNSDGSRFVHDPGAGIAGFLLNDYIWAKKNG